MDNEKRIVKMTDGSEKGITIIISFKYKKNNKNYIVYKLEGSDNTLISSFDTIDDELILNEISKEEANEINIVLKEIVQGGNR